MSARTSRGGGSRRDRETPLVLIPNKLIISPYHIGKQEMAAGILYQEYFKDFKESEWKEYHQLTLFLILERLNQNSFWKPFLDYLPSQNETLFTTGYDHGITNEDVLSKLKYCRDINGNCREEFREFIRSHKFSCSEE